MKLKRYELGDIGRSHILAVLRDGRALSLALAEFMLGLEGNAFTVLPEGLELSETLNFDDHLKQHEYPTGPSKNADRILSDYDPLEALLTALAEEISSRPNAMLWAEDYLARKDDPKYSESFVKTCYLDDTVTYLLRSSAVTSAKNRELLQRLRTIPHWTAAIIDADQLAVLPYGSIGDYAAECMVQTAKLIVVQSYRLDGFVFFKPR